MGEATCILLADELLPRKRRVHELQRDVLEEFSKWMKDDGTLENFKKLLSGGELKRLQDIYDSRKYNDNTSDNIPECITFLSRSKLQAVLAKLLENVANNADYLKLFISRFNAYNECIEHAYLPKQGDRGQRVPVRELDSPLHCAVRQLDGKFIDWLLGQPIEVNLRNKRKETALALLCIRYDDVKQRLKQPSVSRDDLAKITDELKTVKCCIQKLLHKGADFNIYTCVPLAFDLLWKYYGTDDDSEAHDFVKGVIIPNTGAIALSRKTKRNIANDAEGTEKAPTRTVELLYEPQDNFCTVELLEIFLRFNDIEKFKKYWAKFEVTDANVKNVITFLLHTAVDQKLNSCVKKIIDKAENMIFKDDHRAQLKGLLKKPCLSGDPNSLKIILNCVCDGLLLPEIPLLVTTVNKAHRAKKAQEANLLDCAKVLIENCKKVPIHATDSDGNTALHLALKFGYETLALRMLEKQHGLLELRNRRNQTPVDFGTLEFWVSYLDGCITTKDRTVVRLDVGFLRPIEKEKTTKATKATGDAKGSCCRPWRWPDSWKILQPVKEVHNSKCLFAHTVTEMTVLRLIAQSKERNQLLLHPTLTSFIMLKWMRLCHWNLLNLLLTTFTMLCFGAYTLMSCSYDGYTAWSLLPRILSDFGALLLSIREIMQLFLLRWSYVTLENVVDIFTIILMIVVRFCGCDRGWWLCAYVPICSSFVVISLALQASFLLGALSFNNLATILYMFKTVSRNFFYSFLLFTPLIGSFVYGFYLTNNVSPNDVIDYCTSDNCSQENFNNFRSFWNATIKTLVMTTGEFEAANVDFEGGKVLLFIAFLFLAPIVILNLINGLAVSDIAEIREESKLISICKKVKQLERYERGVVKFLALLGDTTSTSKIDQNSTTGSIPPVTGNSSSWHSVTDKIRMLFRKPFFPGSFFDEHEPAIFIATKELNKLGLVRKPINDEKNTATSTLESPRISNTPVIDNGSNTTVIDRPDTKQKEKSIQPIPIEQNTATSTLESPRISNTPVIDNGSNATVIDRPDTKQKEKSIQPIPIEQNTATSTLESPRISNTPVIDNGSNATVKDRPDTKQKEKSIQPIPILPGLPNGWLQGYFNFRSYPIPMFVTLDESHVNKAIAIIEKRNAISPTDESLELADTELVVKATDKHKLAIKWQKPIKSSATSAPAGPADLTLDVAGARRTGISTVKNKAANRHQRSPGATTDPRDMQIKLLQEQINTILQVMGDIKQELQAKRNCICENQQRVEDLTIADSTAIGQAGDQ